MHSAVEVTVLLMHWNCLEIHCEQFNKFTVKAEKYSRKDKDYTKQQAHKHFK